MALVGLHQQSAGKVRTPIYKTPTPADIEGTFHYSRVLVNRLPPPPIPALLNSRWILSVTCCSLGSSRNPLEPQSSMETSAIMWW